MLHRVLLEDLLELLPRRRPRQISDVEGGAARHVSLRLFAHRGRGGTGAATPLGAGPALALALGGGLADGAHAAATAAATLAHLAVLADENLSAHEVEVTELIDCFDAARGVVE